MRTTSDPRSRDLLWTLTGAIALAYSVLTVAFQNPIIPGALVSPEWGLEASWQLASSEAVARGLRFGRDVVFTVGPFGFLTCSVKTPGLVLASVAWSVVACVAALGLGLGIARRSHVPWWVFLPVFCTVSSLTPSFEARAYGLAVMLIAHHLLARSAGSLAVQMLAAAVLGSAILAKLTFLPVGLGVGAGLAIVDLGQRSWRGGALLALIAATPLVCWIAIYGTPTGYLAYLVTGYEVSRCFSGALQVHGPTIELLVFVASAALLLALVLGAAPGSVPARVVRAIALGGVLFVAFKHGFVRHDIHAIVAWSTCMYTAVFVVPACISAARSRARMAGVGVLCATMVALVWSQDLHGRPVERVILTDILELPQDAGRAARLLRGTWRSELIEEWDGVLARVAADNPLPPSPAPFDLYPFDLRILFAHRLPWRPRPVIQSYQACSAALLERNAKLLRETGAATVLLTVATIDGRLPSIDDGPSWLVFLEHYTVVDRAGAYLVLRRRDHAEPVSRGPRTHRSSGFDERVDLPPDAAAVWASIDVHPTLLGRLVDLFYKLPPLQIALALEDGTEQRFRLVPEMASAGFLLSPLIRRTEDLAPVLKRDQRALREVPTVRSLRIPSSQVPGHAWLFEGRIEIALQPLSLQPTTSPTAINPSKDAQFVGSRPSRVPDRDRARRGDAPLPRRTHARCCRHDGTVPSA